MIEHLFTYILTSLFPAQMHSFNHYASVHVKSIDAKHLLLEHFEKSVKRIILHCYSSDREITLLLLANLDPGASIYRVQSALKVNILHQYACIIFTCTDV